MKTNFPQLIRNWQKLNRLNNPNAARRLGVPLRTFLSWKSGENQPQKIGMTSIFDKLKEVEI